MGFSIKQEKISLRLIRSICAERKGSWVTAARAVREIDNTIYLIRLQVPAKSIIVLSGMAGGKDRR